jgi:organic hydroperoxide reductase OsmC/OhrA
MMQSFPHHYRVAASGEYEGEVALATPGLPPLPTMPPREFDGPGDRWSPETLLVGAIADCFLLSFRALARAAKIEWLALDCEVEGVLDREQGTTRFTHYRIDARLLLPAGADSALAERILHRAEQACLISNSLNGRRELRTQIEIVH